MRNCETEGPPKEIAVDLGGGVKLEMVLIPAGSFMMGSYKRQPYETPVHRVNITKPFYLGKYVVTQEQWQAVMESNPSKFQGRKNPVETVSWDDCQAFLGKLNAKIGGQGGKFVLPTEAQWEYACRAGSTTNYCFGDDKAGLRDYAWYIANSEDKRHPVGEKKPNAFGLYDMHGNVWEWCADCYSDKYYAVSPADDPVGPVSGGYRVLRGGCSFDPESAARGSSSPGRGGADIGFRVSRTPHLAGLPLAQHHPRENVMAIIKISRDAIGFATREMLQCLQDKFRSSPFAVSSIPNNALGFADPYLTELREFWANEPLWGSDPFSLEKMVTRLAHKGVVSKLVELGLVESAGEDEYKLTAAGQETTIEFD